MILIAEIILTIVAWQKGWRGWALLPMAIVLSLAFVMGLAVGAAGGSKGDVIVPCLILDAMGILALVVMTARAPNKVRGNGRPELPAKVLTARG